jgi:hypothetical protein
VSGQEAIFLKIDPQGLASYHLVFHHWNVDLSRISLSMCWHDKHTFFQCLSICINEDFPVPVYFVALVYSAWVPSFQTHLIYKVGFFKIFSRKTYTIFNFLFFCQNLGWFSYSNSWRKG